MCTVTYLKAGDQFLLTMNRDERLDRGREIAPRRFRLNDKKPECAWPIDSDSGGTWIGTNHHGITACILNGYEESDAGRKDFKSRGTIIPQVLQLATLDKVERMLAGDFESTAFKSFSLIVVQRDAVMFLYSNGMGTITFERRDGLPQLWSSSSWKAAEVLPWREIQFSEWVERGAALTEAGIPTYHLLQPEGREAWAPLMKRDKSMTRSITQVLISSSGVSLRYWKCPVTGGSAPDRAIVLNSPSA